MKIWKKNPILIKVVMNGKLAKIIMLDLGANIKLLPTRIWKKLGFPLEPTQYNISLVDGSLVWSLGLLWDMPISFLGITSLATFDVIDMVNIENLEYNALIELEWFVDNNEIINNKN